MKTFRTARLRGMLPPELLRVTEEGEKIRKRKEDWKKSGKRYWGVRAARRLDAENILSLGPSPEVVEVDSEVSGARECADIVSQGEHVVTESATQIAEESEYSDDIFTHFFDTTDDGQDGLVDGLW